MKCKVCGYEYSDEKLFCPMCGAEREDRVVRNTSEMTWNTKDFPKPVQEVQNVNIHWSAPDASEGYVSVVHNEQKKPEKFNTFQAKNEEFQKLLDQEFERLKNIQKETERLNIKSSYDSLFEPKVAAVVDNPVPQFIKASNEVKKEFSFEPIEKKAETEVSAPASSVSDSSERMQRNISDSSLQNEEVFAKVQTRTAEPEPMKWPHVGNLDKPIEKANPVWPSSAPKKRTPAEIYAAMMAAEELEESKKSIGPKAMDNDAFDRMIMDGTKDVSEVPDASPLNLDAEPMAPNTKDVNAFDIKYLEYSIRQIEEEEKHAQQESEERRKKLEAMAAARDAYFRCLDETDSEKRSKGFGFRKEKTEEKPIAPEYAENAVPKIERPLETPHVSHSVSASDYYVAEAVNMEAEAEKIVDAPINFGTSLTKNEEETGENKDNSRLISVEEIITPKIDDREHTTQFDKDEFRAAQKKIEAEFLRIQSAEESEINPEGIEDASPIFMDDEIEAAPETAPVADAAVEKNASEKYGLDDKTFEEFDRLFEGSLTEPEKQMESFNISETAEEPKENYFFAIDLSAETEETAEEISKETGSEITEETTEEVTPAPKVQDDVEVEAPAVESTPAEEDVFGFELSEEVFEPKHEEIVMPKAAEESVEVTPTEENVPKAEEEVTPAEEEVFEAELSEEVLDAKPEETVEPKAPKEKTEWLSLESLEASVAEMAATHNEKGDLSLDESGNVVVELKNGDIEFDEFESVFAEYHEEDIDDTIDTKDIQAALADLEALDDIDDEYDDYNDGTDDEYDDDDDIDDDDDDRSGRRGGLLRFFFLIILIIALIQGIVFALSKIAPDAGFVQTLVAIAESIQAAIDNAAGTAVEKIMNIF